MTVLYTAVGSLALGAVVMLAIMVLAAGTANRTGNATFDRPANPRNIDKEST